MPRGAQLAGASRYRPMCKLVFKLWGDALRLTQLQLHQKKLRRLQAEAAAERQATVAAHRRQKRKKAAQKKGAGPLTLGVP